MNIIYWRDKEEHATALLRYYAPAAYLKAAGHEVIMTDILDDGLVEKADMVVTGQFLTGDNHITVRALKKLGNKVILDADDLYWEGHVNHAKKDIENYKEIAKIVDGITVVSPYLGKMYEKIGVKPEKIHHIPNFALVSDWERWWEKKREIREANKELTLGFMGMVNHLPDLLLFLPVLKEVKKRFPSLNIEVMGLPNDLKAFILYNTGKMKDDYLDDCSECYKQLMDMGVKKIPIAKKYEEFIPKMCSLGWDIGIATLKNSRVDKSKSYLKWMDYSMAGVAAVYRGISPFTDVVNHGVNGFLANSENEWIESLTTLIENPNIRQRLVDTARMEIKSDHNIAKNWQLYDKTYSSIVENA